MAGVPTPAPANGLTEAQLAGEQCVWCPAEITPGTREHVGWTGKPPVRLYGCPACVELGRRLPVWPEPGSC